MYRYWLEVRRRWYIPVIMLLMTILGVVFGVVYVQGGHGRITSFDQCVASGHEATNGDPQTCTDGKTTFAAVAAVTPTPIAALPSGENLDVELLVTGDSGGTYPYTEVAITTQHAWETFWRTVHAGMPTIPPMLPVDFSKNSVIAIVAGQKPTGGYAVDISSVLLTTEANPRTIVSYRIQSPGPTCPVSKAPTNPYLMVMVPKISANVSFIPTDHLRSCSR